MNNTFIVIGSYKSCHFLFFYITPSAEAVCGVAFCVSVAPFTKKDTEQTALLTRLVMFLYAAQLFSLCMSQLYYLDIHSGEPVINCTTQRMPYRQ